MDVKWNWNEGGATPPPWNWSWEVWGRDRRLLWRDRFWLVCRFAGSKFLETRSSHESKCKMHFKRSRKALLQDTLTRHFCKALTLQGTFVPHSCMTLLQDTLVVRHFCMTCRKDTHCLCILCRIAVHTTHQIVHHSTRHVIHHMPHQTAQS